MKADESLVTLSMLKKYDQTKGTPVVEADTLPVLLLNKVYNVGGSPIELSASGTCTHETSPGGTETVTINNLKPNTDATFLTPGTYNITYRENTSWESKEITYRDLTFTAVKMYETSDVEEVVMADSVTIDGTVHSNVTNGEIFTGTGWVIIWNDKDHLQRLYLTDANATLPVVSTTVASGINSWTGQFTVPAGTTEVKFNNDYTLEIDPTGRESLANFPYGKHAIYGVTFEDGGQYTFTVFGYNLPTPTATIGTGPGGTVTLKIENLEATKASVLPAAGTYTLTYSEDTDWTSKEITYRDLTFTAVKRYKIDDGLLEKAIFADSVTIDGTTHSNVTNGEVFTGTGWVIIWNIWDEADNAYDGSIYLTDANATIPTVSIVVASGLNGWSGKFTSIPEGATEVVFNNDYTVKIGLHPFPYGEHALYGVVVGSGEFQVMGYNLPSPTATVATPGSGLYIGDCFFNHLPAGSSFKLKSSIDNVWHTVSYPLPENGTFIYGTSLSEESCLVIQTNDNKLRVVTIDETQNQAFTIDYEEETSTRVFSKSTELITKDSANDLFIPQSEKGVASGVATLGADGKVPRSQLTVEAMEYKGKVYLNTAEPTDKSVGDVYFVGQTGTIWGKSVNEGNQLVWNGSDWDVWSAGRVLSVDGKTNEVVINQSLTSTQYNNLTEIDPKVNYFVTDKKQIYRNGYCYSVVVKALSQSDYNNLTAWEKQDTMALYIVDNNKLYYLNHPVGMLGNELRHTSSIPTEEGFFVYTGNVPNAAGLYRGCIYYKNGSTYTLFTPKYTEDILEKSAFSNIGTAANATQHEVNAAIDTQFASHTWSINNWTLAYS